MTNVTAGLTLASAPAVATMRQGSFRRLPLPRLQCSNRGALSAHAPAARIEGEQSAHTQHKHQRWPELCKGNGKTELALFTELQWEAIYTTLPI